MVETLSAQDRTRQVCAGTLIVLVHAVALYTLALAHPRLPPAVTRAPLLVHFVSSARAPEPAQWQPPLTITSARFDPQMPQIIIEASAPASDRAITLPAQASPPAKARDERGAPRLVAAVEYLREPLPRYPPQSKRLREQGVVVLRVLIDEQGHACTIDVETSSGHPRLDAAAREAVERAAFRPYIEDGSPRRALVLIPIEFALNRSTA
jgi:periplasmic protein TonB